MDRIKKILTLAGSEAKAGLFLTNYSGRLSFGAIISFLNFKFNITSTKATIPTKVKPICNVNLSAVRYPKPPNTAVVTQ